MSLLNNVKPAENVEAGATKVAKKSNSEYQKKQRELSKQYGAQLKAYFGDKVPDELKDAVAFFAKERTVKGEKKGDKPVFYKIFGDTPKVGDKKTALEVFESVGKGYGEMRSLLKKWKDKQNIEVAFDEVAKSYVIKGGDVKPYSAE